MVPSPFSSSGLSAELLGLGDDEHRGSQCLLDRSTWEKRSLSRRVKVRRSTIDTPGLDSEKLYPGED
jgi:hypothetical protein